MLSRFKKHLTQNRVPYGVCAVVVVAYIAGKTEGELECLRELVHNS